MENRKQCLYCPFLHLIWPLDIKKCPDRDSNPGSGLSTTLSLGMKHLSFLKKGVLGLPQAPRISILPHPGIIFAILSLLFFQAPNLHTLIYQRFLILSQLFQIFLIFLSLVLKYCYLFPIQYSLKNF